MGLKRFLDVVLEAQEAPEGTQLLTYGLPFLSTCPGLAGTLMVLGGRSGAGKSYLGLKLLETCLQAGLYVSLEDPAAEVARRAEAYSSARLGEVGLVIPKRPRLSIICREIREAFSEDFAPRMVVIDYIQLIQYDGDVQAWSQTEQIGMIIAELKSLGRELGFVTVLLSQLKRPDRDNRNAFPTLWDLRDSSNIENSAEAVILLQDHGDQVEARLAKNKSGKRGTVQWFDRGSNGYLVPTVSPIDEDLFPVWDAEPEKSVRLHPETLFDVAA